MRYIVSDAEHIWQTMHSSVNLNRLGNLNRLNRNTISNSNSPGDIRLKINTNIRLNSRYIRLIKAIRTRFNITIPLKGRFRRLEQELRV